VQKCELVHKINKLRKCNSFKNKKSCCRRMFGQKN